MEGWSGREGAWLQAHVAALPLPQAGQTQGPPSTPAPRRCTCFPSKSCLLPFSGRCAPEPSLDFINRFTTSPPPKPPPASFHHQCDYTLLSVLRRQTKTFFLSIHLRMLPVATAHRSQPCSLLSPGAWHPFFVFGADDAAFISRAPPHFLTNGNRVLSEATLCPLKK